MTALALNVDFSDAGDTRGAAGIPFGNLTLCGYAPLPSLNGMTVRQILAIVNTALGGGSTGYAIADLNALAEQLNLSFGEGTPNTFALAHLVNGSCP